MISMFRSVYSAILAVASGRVSSRPRTWSKLGALCAVLAVLLCGAGSIAPAQTISGNFGAVNIGTTSSVLPVVITFGTPGTIGATAVLTQGAPGLDFSDAGSDTCTANTAYTAGQTCTVNVTFTPRFAGTRLGAVVLEDSSGNTIATGRLQGTGVGPQIIFQPGIQSTLGSGLSEPASVAVDGNGNIYFTEVGSSVLHEMLAVNGAVPASPVIRTIGSGFGSVTILTVDGAGNLYIADAFNNAVKEILAVNGSIPASPTIKTLGSGFSVPTDVAVDGNGNVYVTGGADNTVKEIVAVNGSIPASPVIRTLASSFREPYGIAVDASGNVYVADSGNNAVKEIVAVNGSIPASPTIKTLGSGYYEPYGLALDGNSNIYVADYGNNAVKEILAVNGSIPASPTIKTLGSGFDEPGGVAVDGGGNVFVADYGNNRVVKLDFADPPSLAFASTAVGSTSSDSPKTITIENAGNAALTFPIPSTGNNPSIAANFTLNSSGSSDCPLLSSESSEPATLAAGASCQLPISFVPTGVGAFSGSLVLTDNDLNVAAPGYASQSILLNGTGTGSFTLGSSVTSLTINQGGSGTSTITVTGQNGFTGSVNLTASGLPSGVTASFSPNPTTGSSILTITASSTSSLASSVVITITGTSGSLTETTTLLLTVNPANFTLSYLPSPLILNQGSSATALVTVYDENGFTGSVNLAAPSLPSGVTASFSPNPTSGTSVLTLTASSTAATGNYNVSITGTSGAQTVSTTILLTVYPPADFGIQLNYTSGQTIEGSFGSFSVSLDYFNGFNSAIALSASGLPAGDSISFSPATIIPAPGYGTSTATVVVGANTAPGVYPITITGIGGGITHYVTYTLTIPTPDFSFFGPSGPQYVFQGGNTSFFIQSVSSNGFNSPISFSLSGQPAGVSFTPLSFPAPGSGEGNINLSIASTTVAGTYPITVIASGGGVTHYVTTSLTVSVPPDFSLSASPAALTVYQGTSTTSTITSAVTGGFNAAISLNTSGAPVYGISPSFAPESLPAPGSGSSTMTIGAAPFVQPGTYTIFISGAGGGILHPQAASIQLNVLQAPSFGSVNVGSTAPAIPFIFGFSSPVTLGAASVVTQGATGQDFIDAGTGSCAVNTAYSQGQTCTINVSFSPKIPGSRYGAVVLKDTSGNVIATDYILGTGVGPQLNFSSGTQTTVPTSNLTGPAGVAVDSGGNIYIADTNNNRVLRETPTAGGYSESTVSSDLQLPTGVAVDGAGNIYIADTKNNRVLKESPVLTGYAESVIKTGLGYPLAIAVDGGGDVYFANYSTVYEVANDGGYHEFSQWGNGFSNPSGLAVDGSGNIFIADTGNNAVKEISGSGTTTTLLSGLSSPAGLALDGEGNLYVSDTGNNRVLEITKASGYKTVTTMSGIYDAPNGLAISGNGNLYVANSGNNLIAMEDFADPPSLDFATTANGSTSPDSPQMVTVENVGNAALTFPIPSTGNNPNITANFTLNSSGSSACPLVNVGSSKAGTLAAGASCQLPISFTPTTAGALSGSLVLTDNNLNAAAPGYATQSIALSGTGTQATPTIAWAMPAAITYGTALSATQLDASSTVAGNFTYSPAAGAVLGAGQQTLTVTFTPTDTADYTTATASVTLTVNQATPPITWATPAAITYGTALSGAQLNASSTVAGSFTYSPATGAVLASGAQTLTVNFTPTDTVDYTTATTSVTLTVNRATPTVTWATPAAITYGSALSGTQLNASSTVAGSFAYSPAAWIVLGAGGQTLTATFTPTDTTDYTTATATVTLTVNRATPTVTWATPAAITYGTPLSGTQLNASSTVAGSFTYSPAAGTVLGAGAQTLTATFTPTDTTDYTTATATVTLTVTRATPTVTWATPAAITYGSALSGTQLNASSTVAGSFTYSPAAGTVLGAGGQTLTATFTPTDTTDYTTATATVTLTVNRATPTVTWSTPAAITYGTPLSGTQLNASSTVAGTFTYSPAAGTVLNAGTQTLAVSFAPTDTTDYKTASTSVTLTVNKAVLTISWATPAPITYGTALSATQLDASSTAAGTFAYSPTAGTVLSVGSHVLTVTLTPTNAANYTTATATATVTLMVNKATPTITWPTPAAITYGTALSATQLDASSTVAGTFTYSPAAKTVLSAGAQTLSVTFAPTNTTNYTNATASVTLTVNKAVPAITWATPAAITYGTALSATQLNASSTVAGTFTYSPATGTVLTAGSQTLSVTFAPTNATNYTTAADSVKLTVNKATPTVKLTSSASSVTSGTSVTFTATLTGSGVKPTGTVTFLDGTTKLGTGTLNGSGVATFATTTLAVGKQSITASYGGDGNYITATSTAVTVTVTAK
jgi:hypothetical protein